MPSASSGPHENYGTIELNHRLRGARRVFRLAHELGHVIAGHKWDLTYGHNVVREEFEAWEIARRLLRRLRVRIDNRLWEDVKGAALRSHFATALSTPIRIK